MLTIPIYSTFEAANLVFIPVVPTTTATTVGHPPYVIINCYVYSNALYYYMLRIPFYSPFKAANLVLIPVVHTTAATTVGRLSDVIIFMYVTMLYTTIC